MPQKPTAAIQSKHETADAIEPLNADKSFSVAQTVKAVLTDGLNQIESELVHVRVGDYLRKNPGNNHAREQKLLLERNRRPATAPSETVETDDGTPPAVAAALKLLQSGLRPEMPNSRKKIADLEDDAGVLRAGIAAQQEIINELRGAASIALATRLQRQHRALVLAQFRAAQAMAGAADELRQFRSNILQAGYEFCGDLLPEPSLRSALILGSESQWNSEIVSTRLLLEKLGIIP